MRAHPPLSNCETATDAAGGAVREKSEGVILSGSANVHRTFDPAFLNTVINHPDVRPWLEGVGELDISKQVFNADNFALVTDAGGFLLIRHEPGRYEVHSQFLPGRGTHAIRAMKVAQEWMFTRTDCEAIVSKVPLGNGAAKGLAITGGLRVIFRREGAEYVELTLMDWAMRTAALESHGERFHAFLEASKAAAGSSLAIHPHDPAHERAVGAALLMIERGQPEKGVDFYNRWARHAGYAEIRLISASPVVVDAVDAVIGMGESGMENLLCR